MTDQLKRYYFPNLSVRLAIVDLENVQRELLERHQYPIAYASALVQLASAAALLRSTVKLDGRLLLQRKEPDTNIQWMAECNHRGEIRGVARYDEVYADRDPATLPGILAITLEPERGERYQGIVAVESANAQNGLIVALEEYFERSEQLPTKLVLANSNQRAVGVLVQRMPQTGGSVESLDADGWNRVQVLLQTLTPAELLELDAETLLHRLFHQEQLQALSVQALRFHCSCSEERVKQMFISLGSHEALACIQADGFATVHCEFCFAQYRFDAFEMGAWFAPAAESHRTQ
jgi:molecular chaperone Hsp33